VDVIIDLATSLALALLPSATTLPVCGVLMSISYATGLPLKWPVKALADAHGRKIL